jgi:hypothetical protein
VYVPPASIPRLYCILKTAPFLLYEKYVLRSGPGFIYTGVTGYQIFNKEWAIKDK